jgi:protein-S-isoprenylcysteine O-methyltransferase Ste14
MARGFERGIRGEMTGIIVALGGRPTARGRLWLFGVIAAGTCAWLGLALVADRIFGVPILVVHLALWVCWLAWLACIFPRARRADSGGGARRSYRDAFYKQIYPGIACMFAQLAHPALYAMPGIGVSSFRVGFAQLGVAVVCVTAGVWMIVLATRAIGIDGALFLYEYAPAPPGLERGRIYGVLRHPLFLGGVLVSIGLGALGGAASLALAVVNVVLLPIYGHVEDGRCCGVFGATYQDYRRQVGGVVPRLWSSVARRSQPPTSHGGGLAPSSIAETVTVTPDSPAVPPIASMR